MENYQEDDDIELIVLLRKEVRVKTCDLPRHAEIKITFKVLSVFIKSWYSINYICLESCFFGVAHPFIYLYMPHSPALL